MSLPYIRAIIEEIRCLAPIGSLGATHATTMDDIYLGRVIPEEAVVFSNLTVLSGSLERHANADIFDPDQFSGDELDASASTLHPDYKRRDHSLKRFGRRLCQGISVAEASLYTAVSRVFWGLNINPHPSAPPLDMGVKTGKHGLDCLNRFGAD
jgi:cytochrome P450